MSKTEPKVIIVPIIVIAAIVGVIGLAIYFSSGPAGKTGDVTKPSYDNALADPVTEQDHARGATNPRVTIVVYSDFQCPACAQFELKTAGQLLEKHPDDVRLVFRHFTINGHPLAQKAAEATEAAGTQGKFWEMANLIFQNQDKLTEPLLTELAQSLGLDMNKFKEELGSGKYKDSVASQKDSGLRSGVTATPTLYINGEKYAGRLSLDEIDTAVSSHLP